MAKPFAALDVECPLGCGVSIQVPWTCTYDGKRTVLASMSPEDVAAAARAHLCSEHRERLDAAESLA